MKCRFFILPVFMLLLCATAHGQGNPSLGPASTPKILKASIGIKAGLNLANINNGQSGLDFSPGMKADFHAGAFLNLHFGYRNEGSPVGTGLFGLQPEVLYSRQGFIINDNAVNFDYITVPIMVKLYVTPDFNIEVGPYIGYLLSVSPNNTVISNAQISLSDLQGGMDAGISAGVGYEFKMGLTVGARYNYGLSDMAGNLAWKNNVIAVSVGWKF